MYIVFEGIDGSGKTTISTNVAKRLRKSGLKVQHVREGGSYSSDLVNRIRAFGKDPQNVDLHPMAEYLLYLTRESQILDECVRPALKENDVVIADRSVYSCEVLGAEGRGLPHEPLHHMGQEITTDTTPDLVVLLDVDPKVARARRKVSKIRDRANEVPKGKGSRKGLGGVGMPQRMRRGYLRLAKSDEAPWLIVDNTANTLEGAISAITTELQTLFDEGPESVNLRRNANPPTETAELDVDRARDKFFAIVDRLEEREPGVAAYFLSGMPGAEAHLRRERLKDRVPHVVAHSLRGLGDDDSWTMREELKPIAPLHVLKSITQPLQGNPRADELLLSLFDDEPGAVLKCLQYDDRDFAWDLRNRTSDEFLMELVSSVRGLESGRDWQLREKLWRDLDVEDDEAVTFQIAKALLGSIKGSSSDRAWEMRDVLFEDYPTRVLRSLKDLTSERSWELRHEYADRAPKIVLRTFDGQESDDAWILRERLGSRAKEAVDSMTGIDSERAWALRERLSQVWPSTVANSLGMLAGGERGRSLINCLLRENPGDISLLKHATQVSLTNATGSTARAQYLQAS